MKNLNKATTGLKIMLLKLLKTIFFIIMFLLANAFRTYFFKLLKIFVNPSYIVLLYPGSSKDISSYVPIWVSPYIRFPFPIGIIRKNDTFGYGLMVAVPDNSKGLLRHKGRCLEIKRYIISIKNIVGAKKIAMVGLLPTIFLRHDITLDNDIVSGLNGTIFSIIATLKLAMKGHEISKSDQLTIIGIGRIGKPLLSFLKNQGFNVHGIDKKQGTKDISILKKSKIVISLVSGCTFEKKYFDKVSSGTIILDDAHPMITNTNGLTIYKVLAICSGISYAPTIPGFKNNYLAGCMVSALVQSTGYLPTNLDDFIKKSYNLKLDSKLYRM